MTIDVAEQPMTALAEYALLPIACRVDHVLDVTARADGSFALSARRLQIPYVKDDDAVDGEGPLSWTRRFDVSNWQLFTARVAGSRVGRSYAVYPELPPEIQLLCYKDLRIAK
jgi:hypothetical protein